MVKRMIIGLVVLAVALASLGLMTAGAQEDETPKAFLGVRIQNSEDGVTIAAVNADGPADEAGLRPGDVIEAVDGTAIESGEQLVEVISGYAPGDTVTLTVSWRGESRDVTATLVERPADVEALALPGVRERIREHAQENMPMMQGALNLLGLELSTSDEGVVVDGIAEDSPLADSGLQEGDVITALNGEPLDDFGLQQIMQALHMSAKEGTLALTVERAGEEVAVEIDLSALDLGDLPFGMMTEGAPGAWNMPGMPGTVGRPYLGVSFQAITAELAESEGLSVDQGALVREVAENTPAAQAGLVAGDIITAVNGEAVDETHTLAERLFAYEPGDTVTLDVLREGETLSLEVELASRMGAGMGAQSGGMGFGPMMGDGHPCGGMMGHMGQGMMGRGRDRGHMGQGMMGHMMGSMMGHMMGGGRMGQGMMGHMMDEETMRQFFENHPFMGQMFEMMPEGGMWFEFGPGSMPDMFAPDAPAPDSTGQPETGSAA